MRKLAAILAVVIMLSGCVQRPEPPEASWTKEAPPWQAPRDAISWIKVSGMPQLTFGETSDPWVIDVAIRVNDKPVEIPAYIGMDRLRAVQVPVHTHDTTGVVWLEGKGNREVTLSQFFRVWGVHFDDSCLAKYCTDLVVKADGKPVSEPTKLVLRGVKKIEISVHGA